MKKKIDLARAWRDQDYYLSLTEEERADLGAHPAGALALMEDTVLKSITGGCSENCTVNCSVVCDTFSFTTCDTSGTAVCTGCPPYDCM
jgi:mersacidin/lichenicidin family type 2 lantibiotic